MTDRFGVVYTISPSPLDAKTVWVGTDDGLIHVTSDDGANWKDVTPPQMTAWSKVSQIEAGHFDLETAYASIDRHRLADDRPYIYRTHDGGKSWKNVVDGIPDGAFVNSVKEDTKQKGLLYAATELRVYVSFDDGDHWQPLQLNMPVTSVRDIVVHGDDLAVATFGRGFWVLDQMAALRQIAAHGKEIEGSLGVSVCPRRDDCHSPGRPEWNALAARRTAGVESSRRRHRLLLAEVRAQRPAETGTCRCKRQGGCLPRQRYTREASRHRSNQCAGLLAGTHATAIRQARHASRRTERCPSSRIRIWRWQDVANASRGCLSSCRCRGSKTRHDANASGPQRAGPPTRELRRSPHG